MNRHEPGELPETGGASDESNEGLGDDALAPRPNSVDPELSRWAGKPLAPGLYLVATPIGNLEDISLRALRVLRSVDLVACEDTRQTAKLLGHFGIGTPTVSYHLHNEVQRADELLEALRGGGRVALVSDAGTPGIADPGATIVTAAIGAGVPVFPIPGANAALSALVASGLPTEGFAFHGFLPSKRGQRRSWLEALHGQMEAARTQQEDDAHDAMTQVLYEAPHRIAESLEDVVAVFGGGQRVVLAREVTKLHEEFLRGTAAEVLGILRERPSVRGEMVLLLDGRRSNEARTATAASSLAEEVTALMRSESIGEMEAIKRVAKTRGLGKSEAYREWQRSRRRSR